MRRIEKAFSGQTFALAVFLAVYIGLLAIAFMPHEKIGLASNGLVGASHGPVDSAAESQLVAKH